MARAGGLPLPTITDDRAIGEAVIQRSLRFRRGGSTYLSRTPASQGDRRKFTISWWMKISQVTSSTNTIFSAQRSTLNPDFQIIYTNMPSLLWEIRMAVVAVIW